MKYLRTLIAISTIILLSPICQGQVWTSHSVLSSGSWHKIAIAQNGVYHLSSADIPALEGCQISKLAIYGQPGGMLPETNGHLRPDDLQEMAISIHDANNNGIFNADDYILFYAQGPDAWEYQSSDNSFIYHKHCYTKHNYCFLTTSANNGKRITTSNLTANASDVISSYTSRAHYENDLTNPEQSGRLWMGEIFSTNGQQKTFSLALPSRSLSNIKVRYGMVSLSANSARFEIAVGSSSSSLSMNSQRYTEGSASLSAPTSGDIPVSITYHSSSSGDKGYLDYITINATSPLSYAGGQMDFRSINLINDSLIHTHLISQAPASLIIWDITDYHNASSMKLSFSGNTAYFASPTLNIHEFIAFDGSSFLSPTSITPLSTQDLHALEGQSYVIVSHPKFIEQANDILIDNLTNGIPSGIVITDEQVYNEFSSGKQDPMAIREFMRMLYQRSLNDPSLDSPQYLLLFGKGSYDPMDIEGYNWPTVITGESVTSFGDNGITYCSDDIFGYLSDNEGFIGHLDLNIAVGRIPARTTEEANLYAKKHRNYVQRSDLQQSNIRGDWRNYVALLADDADPSNAGDTTFVNTCEEVASKINARLPFLNIDKIYADSYHQRNGAIGSYYPDANNALKTRMDYGCLLLNYVGHGSVEYIGTEKYMTKTDISGYKNHNQQTFFVTSTCSFGRYDKTNTISGAEAFLFAKGGGIGVISAARPIANQQHFVSDLCELAVTPGNTIGDALRIAKNNHTVSHCITLFGDPALRLSIPENEVKVTAINSHLIQDDIADTATVLSSVIVEGEIVSPDGTRLNDFNGILYSTVYDRKNRTTTLANDNEGTNVAFSQQKNILYRGSDSIHNGTFRYEFIVPRDVAYTFDFGKLSHFAKSGNNIATGSYSNILFGGFNDTVDLSIVRPDIRLFMNDSSFRNGGITDNNPAIFAILHDKVGINSVGSGLGHDITAIIDDNYNEILTLNDYYETDIEDNHKGFLRYYLNDLEPGLHTLTLKAWNIYNYSNSATITFLVKNPGEDPEMNMCVNIAPNPSTERATIRVEHNIQGAIDNAHLEIFDMNGRLVKTFDPQVNDNSFAVGPVTWDFTTNAGISVPNGIYLLRATITTKDGEKLFKKGKIVRITQ